MYSRISNSQTKLWVLTLGIAISVLAFSPPCAPWKSSTGEMLMDLKEEIRAEVNHGKVKDRVRTIFEDLSD